MPRDSPDPGLQYETGAFGKSAEVATWAKRIGVEPKLVTVRAMKRK